MENDHIEISKIVFEQIKTIKAEFSNANVLITGKTGAGKSTLINAVFHGDMAETGVGKPVTQNIQKYSKPGIPINIYDSKGLEMEKYEETLRQITDYIEKLRTQESEEHIHLAWICIDGGPARFEDGERKLIELLNQYNIPVFVVITKTTEANPPLKQAIFNEVGNLVKDIVAVSAIGEELKDRNGNTVAKMPPEGLKELISLSYHVIPEGKQAAFVSAQKISMELKKEKVGIIIKASAATAGVAATNPIPLSDSALIIPIQVGMIVKITMTYGIPLEEGAMTALASSVVGCIAATALGRSIVGNLLKLSGFGNMVGGAINATVAATITKTLGEMYNQIILKLYSEALNNNTELNVDDIIKTMRLEWDNRGINL